MSPFIKTILISSVLLSFLACDAHAARNDSFTVTHKYASNVDGYFNTPHLIKARAFYDQKKTIDLYDDATITVANQVGYAAGSQSAVVFTPDNLSPDTPVGIYIHINYSDTANLPTNLDAVLQKHNLIGASPNNAGNSRHDPERFARVIDLVTTLKEQYNIDNSRIYVGGTSGGALEAVLCGMLYPETFAGVIATEHVMDKTYWQKVYTLEDMYVMANRGQRWSHILGEDSYAVWTLPGWATAWKYNVTVDSSGSPTHVIYDPFFDTYNVLVPGMGHSNPPPDVFEKSLNFVDAPTMLPRVKTYQDWEPYAFRLDNPNTVFTTYYVGETPPVAGDPTINHLPEDDFDGDGYNNWHEYLANSDPTIPNDTPSILNVSKTTGSLSYRSSARYHQLSIHTSTNLTDWETTGNGVHITSTIEVPGQAMASVHFAPGDTSHTRYFYKPVITHTPPINLTQLSGVTASQLTTGWGGLAGYAIDGNRDPDFDNDSTTHTDNSSQNWWQVDLGAERELHTILLFNRSNNQTRLSNFRVSILNENDEEVVGKDYYVADGHVGSSEMWNLPGDTRGNKIKISMLGENRQGNMILSLAEVEVLGPTP